MKLQFQKYINSTNVKGSGKASSYIRALNMLGEILSVSTGSFNSIPSIWQEENVQVIDALYDYIKDQQKSGDIFQTGHAPSYWKNGYYSAAIAVYRDFLIEYKFEQVLDKGYRSEFNHKNFEVEPENTEYFIKEYGGKYGKEKISEVKTRVGQNVFRKMILSIYNDQCCITGLNIPQINRASHIIPWSEKEDTRMDPANGLCLSATYDAAFDKNLISLDEDYRVILSKNLKEHYTKDVVKDYFHNFEGKVITLPKSYIPNKDYLENHRKKLAV